MDETPRETARKVLLSLYEATRPHGRLANWLAAQDIQELWNEAKHRG